MTLAIWPAGDFFRAVDFLQASAEKSDAHGFNDGGDDENEKKFGHVL